MFHVILYEPEIPPNTGNIIRLCANTGTRLHLIQPLGFDLDDKRLRRAGLDYHEWADVHVHPSLKQGIEVIGPRKLYALTTKGASCYAAAEFQEGDVLLFGPESRGLPADVLSAIPENQRLFVPMVKGSRSLNLSNAAALVLYEAWRQNGFHGAALRM